MKIILERHNYAPELTTAHIVHRGRVVAALPAPGATSIRDARRALFAPVTLVRGATVTTRYANGWPDRWRCGRATLADVAVCLRQERARANIPGATVTARTYLGAVGVAV